MGSRHKTAWIRKKLETIHPNPGPRPMNINKWAEKRVKEMKKRQRKEKRKNQRKEKWDRMIKQRRDKRQEMKTKKAKERKRERKRWTQKLNQKYGTTETKETVVTTWNVQRCRIQTDGRGRIQHVLRTIEEHKWDIILLSEITSKEEGVWWYSEDSVMIHGNRAAVILKGQWAKDWLSQGSRKWLDERVAMVTVNGTRLIAVYQPVSPNLRKSRNIDIH